MAVRSYGCAILTNDLNFDELLIIGAPKLVVRLRKHLTILMELRAPYWPSWFGFLYTRSASIVIEFRRFRLAHYEPNGCILLQFHKHDAKDGKPWAHFDLFRPSISSSRLGVYFALSVCLDICHEDI